MSKFLAGVFMGVFTGALAYEVMRRSNPELDKKFRDCVDRVADKVGDYVSGVKKSGSESRSKMESIPVE